MIFSRLLWDRKDFDIKTKFQFLLKEKTAKAKLLIVRDIIQWQEKLQEDLFNILNLNKGYYE